MNRAPPLACRDLTKVYDGTRALDGVSFSVGQGEVFGLLGPNGAGKSTCMKIFGCLIKSTSGIASVGGWDVSQNPVDAKRMVGFLPEFPMLFDNLTGREFVTMMGMMRGLSKREVDSRISRFTNALDLEEQVDSLLGTYSKGMRQKISFTAAVLHDPPILILDEPTSGLDPRFGRYIKDIIREKRDQGKTILLSTHITTVAEELCGRIAIIDKGSIAVSGTIGEVLASLVVKNLEDAFIRVVEGRDSNRVSGGR